MDPNRFTTDNADEWSENIADQFRQAFAEENFDAANECLNRLTKILETGKPTAPSLLALLRQLRLLFANHSDLLKVWFNEHPEALENMEPFSGWIKSF
jgi:hypothetical protein